jgi:alkanesulfonate monooxygenase SsuD/methylene tetrahydromethanopterin reductase-like flavin-dependent oxidoreductase (luciferase family)
MAVDLGLGLPFAGPPLGAPVSRWMDDLNASLPKLQGLFKSLWFTDHFFWLDDPTYEAWTVLSYVAALFPLFQIGPMVLGQSYRNPAMLAKMAATLQTLSDGRFLMGIGAGWKEDEYHAYNYPYPAAKIRMEELVDTLEILKRLWTEPGPVTYHGKHSNVDTAWCEPKPDPVPPIMIGGGGSTTLKITAKYADWWNLSDANLERYKDRLQVLKAACEAIGRDPSTMRLTWFGRMAVGKTEAEAIKWGKSVHTYATDKEADARGKKVYTRDNALVGTPAQVVEQMKGFIDLGVDYFMFEILGLPDPDVLGMVTEQVVPHIR